MCAAAAAHGTFLSGFVPRAMSVYIRACVCYVWFCNSSFRCGREQVGKVRVQTGALAMTSVSLQRYLTRGGGVVRLHRVDARGVLSNFVSVCVVLVDVVIVGASGVVTLL